MLGMFSTEESVMRDLVFTVTDVSQIADAKTLPWQMTDRKT